MKEISQSSWDKSGQIPKTHPHVPYSDRHPCSIRSNNNDNNKYWYLLQLLEKEKP